jgi:hypothetical protein
VILKMKFDWIGFFRDNNRFDIVDPAVDQ